MSEISLGLASLSLAIWLGLLLFRGQFWRSDQQLETDEGGRMKDETTPDLSLLAKHGAALPHPSLRSVALPSLIPHPSVCAIIPARNEADLLPVTLRSLLMQDYPGPLTVILVDDHSTDGTAAIAQATAESLGKLDHLQVITAEPLPPGWTGKLWAMQQGIQQAQVHSPDYILLTDADIEHDHANLRRLIAKAVQNELDMASVMVRLRCESFWERLLIPAFVFFFEKLYPFRWVNDPRRSTAAAAGGCILIRQDVLNQIGSIQSVRHALIDDCALAQAVKLREQGTGDRGQGQEKSVLYPHPSSFILHPSPGAPYHKIWLGLSSLTHSLRPYPSLATIWDMVARTAYTQLGYSPWLLMGTLVGMTVIYLVPPIALAVGVLTGQALLALAGLLGWLLMSLAYTPTVRFYRGSAALAGCLPAIAALYTLMTLDSALRHWQGRGGAWKGRVYQTPGIK